jgi:hypothetical protein
VTRPTIGGQLDYRRLADLHRPRDPSAIATEVRRLHATGLTAQDIAAALRLAPDHVLTLLATPESSCSANP